jgi:predicted RNase H-like nuclease (RuvC/YqgF family)
VSKDLQQLERKIESQAREIGELKAQLPNRNRHSVMIISELRAEIEELNRKYEEALTMNEPVIKELRAALVVAVSALEVVCKYDREERNQPYEDGELALTRCKEVLDAPR